MRKATTASEATTLEAIPNVGPAVAVQLKKLGIQRPGDLAEQDPYVLYQELIFRTGTHHDPCLLDTFIAATRFMAGEPARPWWHYTAERKARLSSR